MTGVEFDAAMAATVLLHLPKGERGVPELARVVRPGGQVGVFEPDGDSLLVAHPDRALTRRIVAVYANQYCVDSWLGRRLPGLIRQAGLIDVRVRAFTVLDQVPDGHRAKSLERSAELAAQTGAITEAEKARWLEQLRAEREAGRFLAGLTYVFAWGVRPSGETL